MFAGGIWLRRNGKLKAIAAALGGLVLLIAGASVMLYPYVSDYYNRRHQTEVITAYADAVNAEEKAAIDSRWEQAQDYNSEFAEAGGGAPLDNYMEILNIDGVMGYIEIPKISVYLPIYHTAGEEALQKGVGHIEYSSLPVGGEGSRALLTGHRGLPRAELFTRLDEMEEGDVFYIHILDRTLTYSVTQTEIIKPYEFKALEPVCGKDLLTLITCTPYGLNSHRLLVTGERIYDEAPASGEPETYRPNGILSGGTTSGKYFRLGALLGLGIFAALLLTALILTGVRRYRRKLRAAKHLRRGGNRKK